MKLKKIFAALAATAVATSMAVSASAATISDAAVGPVTLDNDTDPKTNMLQIDLAAFEGIEGNIASVDITVIPGNGLGWEGAAGNGWFGGGWGFGLNSGEDGSTWYAFPDVAGDGTDDISKGWADVANADITAATPYSFTYTVPDGTVTIYTTVDEETGEEASAGIIQFGYWWGSNNAITITDLTVNFTDGTAVDVVDADATAAWDSAAFVAAVQEIVNPVVDEAPEGGDNGDTAPEETPDNGAGTGLVGLSVAGLAVAGAAVVASKKRK